MLKIRLQRIGKKGQAYFRLVVTEHTRKPQGRFLEDLGSYNPHTKGFQPKAGRIHHWIEQGAQLSGTVNNLLVERKIIEGQKVKTWRPKKKKSEEEKEGGKNTAASQVKSVEPAVNQPSSS